MRAFIGMVSTGGLLVILNTETLSLHVLHQGLNSQTPKPNKNTPQPPAPTVKTCGRPYTYDWTWRVEARGFRSLVTEPVFVFWV